mmetsp:Transcript_67603/g.180721  ORF Transcript_67603/g.180721 Transcript_67603/m.180721 type:complete len:300 (+) Transcript_67603:21-920(+)
MVGGIIFLVLCFAAELLSVPCQYFGSYGVSGGSKFSRDVCPPQTYPSATRVYFFIIDLNSGDAEKLIFQSSFWNPSDQTMLNQSYGYRIYIGDNCLPDPSTSTKTSSDMIKDTGTSKTISISVSGSSRFYLALFLREEMSGSLAGVSGPTSPCSFTIDMSNAELQGGSVAGASCSVRDLSQTTASQLPSGCTLPPSTPPWAIAVAACGGAIVGGFLLLGMAWLTRRRRAARRCGAAEAGWRSELDKASEGAQARLAEADVNVDAARQARSARSAPQLLAAWPQPKSAGPTPDPGWDPRG